MIRRPPRSTLDRSSAASDVYKRQAAEGLDSDGGLWYEYEQESSKLIYEKHSWPQAEACLLYTSPSPRDRTRSRMPSSA